MDIKSGINFQNTKGKIGLIAPKDDDFRKIPLKTFGTVKYHRKNECYLKLAFRDISANSP